MGIKNKYIFHISAVLFLLFLAVIHHLLHSLSDVLSYMNNSDFTPNSISCMTHEASHDISWLRHNFYEDDFNDALTIYDKPTKRLLVVAHYRGGSSFLGDIFAKNPIFFYWYEPLLAYYRRIIDDYVTYNLRVVADTYYVVKNDILRHLPEKVTWYRTLALNRTLWCRVCSEGYNLHIQTNIRDRGMSMATWNASKKTCGRGKQPFPEACMAVYYQACWLSSMVVTKTIRYPLYLVHELLDADPDLKVIYSIRDPRAIINSRRNLTKVATPEEEWIDLGISYCHKFKLDKIVAKELVDAYPNRVLFIRYEDLAASPMYNVRLMYDFVGFNVPKVVEQWVSKNTEMSGEEEKTALKDRYSTSRNSTKVSHHWRQYLPQGIIEGITTGCGDILDDLGYK